ncbi:MAG: lipopolysaccharide transport periplasmic protein LptA [Epsilonproteobacteria bacterium]|nr:MAG: lipopolysaccharide transport periplasmic protein LptA [Campylobacterota bacterium]
MIKNNKIYVAIIFILTLLVSVVNAEENYLNIDAIFFEADEKEQLLYFKGDVKMTKNKDKMFCQSLIINTMPSKKDPTKQVPKDYTATGDVSFEIHTVDNILKGKGDTVFYYPLEQKYIIIGNGYLEDIKEGKKITANKIYIDELTGHTKIDGDKDKPVKFRLRLNSDTKNNDTNATKEVK